MTKKMASGGKETKKLISKTAWFRPQDTVMSVPVTPNGQLANRVRKVTSNND